MKNISFIIKSIFKSFLFVFKFINKKKLFYIPFYLLITFMLFIFIFIQSMGDKEYSYKLKNKRINDVTRLNPIYVNSIIKPTKVEEIITAIKNTNGHISIGGGKYSMGGQTAFENSLHIDMRSFNNILNLDVDKKQITVQSGVTWRKLQNYIDPYDLSVKIMQTYANFTVGGSLSVNAHGRYIGHGPIISSVQNLKVILASGAIVNANRNENQDIFNAIIGGYGGIGVITEVTLQLVDNIKVERKVVNIEIGKYNDFFNANIRDNKNVIFQNGDLYPPLYKNIRNISWQKTSKKLTSSERVIREGKNYKLEQILLQIISFGDFGKWVRQYIIDPIIYMNDEVYWRNKEASYDVNELEPKSRKDTTYVLQEYFIPVNNIMSFIPKMRNIYNKYDVNIINISLRHALEDKESYLSWAKEEVFAFVVYYKQNTDNKSRSIVKIWTKEMTDAILSERGSWYLPYQPHATIEQFNKAYPNSKKYFNLKYKVDPYNRFTNKLLDKYNPYVQKRNKKKYSYYKTEEQTILTIPEWYLVFNPKEYSEYLEDGKNPSNFPFYASLNEYWTLYDRSLKLVSEAYPYNQDYITMLNVIGISTTIEYSLKMFYENTFGKLFSLFSTKNISNSEKMIYQAHKAYSEFIYDTAWYKFEFLPWIKKVWKSSESNDASSVRRVERSILFTMEFTFKAFYSQLLQWTVESTYEKPSNKIYLTIETDISFKNNKKITIIKEDGNNTIIAITRWGEFTKTMIGLSDLNISIIDISGNHKIALSVISNKNNKIKTKDLKLYDSNIVTNTKLIRSIYFIPVNKLFSFIKDIKSSNAEVEHIYDY